jgi:hypothetical protein
VNAYINGDAARTQPQVETILPISDEEFNEVMGGTTK